MMLAVTPTSNRITGVIPVPHDAMVSLAGSSSFSKKARSSSTFLYCFVSVSRRFWNGNEMEPGICPEDSPVVII